MLFGGGDGVRTRRRQNGKSAPVPNLPLFGFKMGEVRFKMGIMLIGEDIN